MKERKLCLGQKSLVINLLQTINHFTSKDAYPLLKITKMVSEITKYSLYSKLDLKCACHQIPLHKTNHPYTAFEAGDNRVARFQRILDKINEKEGLKGIFAKIDDMIKCGINEREHGTKWARSKNWLKTTVTP